MFFFHSFVDTKSFANKKARNCASKTHTHTHMEEDQVWDDDGFRKRWKFSDKPNCRTDVHPNDIVDFFPIRTFLAFYCCRNSPSLWNHSFRIISNNSPERFFSFLRLLPWQIRCTRTHTTNGKMDEGWQNAISLKSLCITNYCDIVNAISPHQTKRTHFIFYPKL